MRATLGLACAQAATLSTQVVGHTRSRRSRHRHERVYCNTIQRSLQPHAMHLVTHLPSGLPSVERDNADREMHREVWYNCMQMGQLHVFRTHKVFSLLHWSSASLIMCQSFLQGPPHQFDTQAAVQQKSHRAAFRANEHIAHGVDAQA